MRCAVARSSLLVSCVLLVLGPACAGDRICDPGRVVSCPCVGGPQGTQSCNADGMGFGACAGCETNEPATRVREGEPCVYPEDNGTAQPTSGYCDGTSALACGADGVMHRDTCASGATCTEVAVQQFSGRTTARLDYRWASCVPSNAEPCAFAFDGHTWQATVDPDRRCDDARTQSLCRMPLPDAGFPWGAGTPQAFFIPQQCEGGDVCQDGFCYVSLTPCALEYCEGNDLIRGCPGLPQRQHCGPATTCRSNVACDGDGADCYPNAPTAPRCNPDTFEGGCSENGSVLTCNGINCSGDTTCTCDLVEVGCGDGLECRSFTLPGGPLHQCVWDVDCAPGPRCEEQSVIRCDDTGIPDVTHCGPEGMTCLADGTHAGCVAGEETCDPGTGVDCTESGGIEGCCPATGLVDLGVKTLPCIPGRRVTTSCPVVPGAPPYTCTDGRCTLQ